MAEKKINITELSGQVAERCSVKTNEAKRFIISLNAALKEAINNDEIVKISGLGTFKVITTEPRKSVDVNTGAEITIGSYRKVTFTPEQSVKTMLNKQFEELPAVDVDDDFELRRDDTDDIPTTDNTGSSLEDNNVQLASSETIDEIKNLLAAINGGTTDEREEERKEENEAPSTEEKEGEGNNVIIEQKDTDLTSSIQEDTNVNADNQTGSAAEIADEPEEQSSPVTADNEVTDEPQPQKKKKKEGKTSFWKIALLMIVIFSVIFGLFYFLLIRHIDKWTKEYVEPAQVKVDSQLSKPEQTASAIEQSGEAPAEQTAETLGQTEPEQVPQVSTKANNGGEIAQNAQARTTETVIVGSRLTQISRRHYGHPEFWIYIYLANKDKFPNGPNSVVVGTKLVIPDMPAEMIDPNSQDAIAQAQELQKTL